MGRSIPIDKVSAISLCGDRFTGFPYITTRLVPGLYHIILLPGEYTTTRLYEIVRKQAHANKLQTCLVLDEKMGFYIEANGKEHLSDFPPIGGVIVTNKLKSCKEFPLTEDYQKRRLNLDEYAKKTSEKGGHIFGDLSCGSRDATPEELALLKGNQKDGKPKGLVKCPVCKLWKGECIRQDPENQDKLFRIHCSCDNDNRCARCGGLLYEKKLNSNVWGPDESFIHVPGFVGLNHTCDVA